MADMSPETRQLGSQLSPPSSSAVLPETGFQEAPSPQRQKRRQSSATLGPVPSPDTKRVRRESIHHNQLPGHKSNIVVPPASKEAERKRSQRLFGGVLSTLSQQPSAASQLKRREIEKRQEERRRVLREDEEKNKVEKVKKLRDERLQHQSVWERDCMESRHANSLAMANFLSTRAQPKLYYKPWELLPQHEVTIKNQLTSVRKQIETEVADFYRAHPDLTRPNNPPSHVNEEMIDEQPVSENGNLENLADATTNVIDEKVSFSKFEGTKEESIIEERDEGEETMVEADEDTVIY